MCIINKKTKKKKRRRSQATIVSFLISRLFALPAYATRQITITRLLLYPLAFFGPIVKDRGLSRFLLADYLFNTKAQSQIINYRPAALGADE